MKLFLILILQLLWIGIFPQVPQNSSKLPTPTSEFFKSINLNSRITIEEYIKTYFSGGKHIKVLDSTAWDTDGIFRDCHTVTEYERVTIENYNCEMFSTFNFIFKGYSKAEVMRIMRLLFTDTDYDYWEGDNYGPIEEGAGCFMSITQKPSETIVSYGCEC